MTIVPSLLTAAGMSDYVALMWISIVLSLAVGVSATIAAFTSRTTAGRRAGGGILGILYLILPIVSALAVMSSYASWSYGFVGNLATVLSFSSPALLFFSWAIARPFRGPGYFAVIIGVVLYAADMYLPNVLGYVTYLWNLQSVFSILLGLLMVGGTVGAAVLFEKNTQARVATVPVVGGQGGGAAVYPGYVTAGTTNGLAVAALVLGVVGAWLLAVIFGHIAKSQIRRTGQAGDGMATAGLVLGYLWAAVSIVIIIWSITTTFSALNSFSSYYG
jgi:hypothetical protein